ncbi:MAG: hypothetical protein AAGD35_21010 [Actinomycetota bacterium]
MTRAFVRTIALLAVAAAVAFGGCRSEPTTTPLAETVGEAAVTTAPTTATTTATTEIEQADPIYDTYSEPTVPADSGFAADNAERVVALLDPYRTRAQLYTRPPLLAADELRAVGAVGYYTDSNGEQVWISVYEFLTYDDILAARPVLEAAVPFDGATTIGVDNGILFLFAYTPDPAPFYPNMSTIGSAFAGDE